EVTNGMDSYLKQFERFENQTNQPSWLFPLRKAGVSCFAEQGFPTLKDEDWRFTNVAPIAALPFKPFFDSPADNAPAKMLDDAVFANLKGSRLVFVNGRFAAGFSSVHGLPPGVKLSNLEAALAKDSSFIEKHLGRYAQAQGNAF